MPDISAIAGLVSSLKAATDISKGMLGLRDAAVMQTKVIELQGAILSAQQSALNAQAEQFTLIEQVRDLERQIRDLQSWEAEKSRYRMKYVANGATVYEPIDAEQRGEPNHWLCPSCFHKSKKSILQDNGRTQDRRENVYRCQDCKLTVLVPYTTHPGK